MARHTQELSVIFFVLLCVAVFALIAYFIFSLMKKRKIPAIAVVVFVIVAVILAIVFGGMLLVGNNHPSFAPTY